MHTLFLIFELLFTYCLASLALLPLIKCISDNKLKQEIMVYALGLGPILISWLLTMLFYILPNLTTTTYILIINALLLIILFANYRICSDFFKEFTFSLKFDKRTIAIWFVVTFLCALLIIHAMFTPITGHDQMEFLTAAKYLFLDKSMNHYPYHGRELDGFIIIWTHPPGYVGLLTWHYLLQNTIDVEHLTRLVAPFYGLLCALITFVYCRQFSKHFSILAILLLLSMPLYYYTIVSLHIDPIRMYAFLALILIFARTCQFQSIGLTTLYGIILASALFTHSINVLLVPIFVGCYIFIRPSIHLKNLAHLIATILIALLLLSPYYLANYFYLGGIIQDNNVIWSLNSINYTNSINALRGLFDTPHIIFNGLLQGFTKLKLFGISFWIFLLTLVIFIYKRVAFKSTLDLKQDYSKQIIFIVLGIFSAMMVVSIALNMNVFIKNPRYLMTLHPFIVIGTVILLCFKTKKEIS